MPAPGEIMHGLGRTYQDIFIAALQSSIPEFWNHFTVQQEPSKTSFPGQPGKPYSFDFSGTYADRLCGSVEVFGESKGYKKGSSLLPEFREFVAKAYVTSTDYERNRKDLFWFVTNVPFACNEGSGLRTFEFIKKALSDKQNSGVQEILGPRHIDDNMIRDLLPRVGIFIFTDSLLQRMYLRYTVKPGDNLWTIMERFHGGKPPRNFNSVAQRIAEKNRLKSPNKILSGTRILVPWFGITPESGDHPEQF